MYEAPPGELDCCWNSGICEPLLQNASWELQISYIILHAYSSSTAALLVKTVTRIVVVASTRI